MITGDVGVTTLKLSFIGVCLMGDPVGIGRAHDCPILTVETEHLSNIMDKDEKTETPEVEKIHEKYVMEVLQKSLNIHDKSYLPSPSFSVRPFSTGLDLAGGSCWTMFGTF